MARVLNMGAKDYFINEQMKTDFRNIHIGELLKMQVEEKRIEIERICKFIPCSEEQLKGFYQSANMDIDILLRWCKLLEYDFFRIFSQHLILYSPPAGKFQKHTDKSNGKLPVFRKNIYTKGIIDFILEIYDKKEKTAQQIIDDYRIPKTTLYKWISKYTEKK